MSKRILIFLAAILSVVEFANAIEQAPTGWGIGSDKGVTDFSVKVLKGAAPNDKNALLIESGKENERKQVSILQTIRALRYTGERVEFSADIKSEDVSGGVELWMRVDGRDGAELALNNMDGVAVRGTTSWGHHKIAVDVPMDAGEIVFGVFLSGKGKAYIGNIDFRTIPNDSPLKMVYSRLPDEPVNLKLTMAKADDNSIPGWDVIKNGKYNFFAANNADENIFTIDGSRAGQRDKFEIKQRIDPAHYKGKDISFTAFLSSENIAPYAGLWVSVKNSYGKRLAHYDEFQWKTGVSGTTKFAEHTTVLYVRPDTSEIDFGVSFSGAGILKIKDLDFKVNDETPEMPVNLELK